MEAGEEVLLDKLTTVVFSDLCIKAASIPVVPLYTLERPKSVDTVPSYTTVGKQNQDMGEVTLILVQ